MITYEEKLNRDAAWALLEGSMHFEETSAVHETLRNLTQALNELGVDYAVAGSMAMFLHGFRRFTEDVHVLVTREGLVKIHQALEGRGYVKPLEASKSLRDTRTGVKIDFLITGQFPGDVKREPIAFPDPAKVSKELDGMSVVELIPLIELKLAPAALRIGGKISTTFRHLFRRYPCRGIWRIASIRASAMLTSSNGSMRSGQQRTIIDWNQTVQLCNCRRN